VHHATSKYCAAVADGQPELNQFRPWRRPRVTQRGFPRTRRGGDRPQTLLLITHLQEVRPDCEQSGRTIVAPAGARVCSQVTRCSPAAVLSMPFIAEDADLARVFIARWATANAGPRSVFQPRWAVRSELSGGEFVRVGCVGRVSEDWSCHYERNCNKCGFRHYRSPSCYRVVCRSGRASDDHPNGASTSCTPLRDLTVHVSDPHVALSSRM
jgi:hypothetical protein